MRARQMLPVVLLVIPLSLAGGSVFAQTARPTLPVPPEEPVMEPEAPRAIKVTGEGAVEGRRTRRCSCLRSKRSRNRGGAGRWNANHTAALMHALKAQGIDSEDIETSRYELLPVYSEASNAPRGGKEQGEPTSYRAVNALQVTVKDLKRVGEVIDAAKKGGSQPGGADCRSRWRTPPGHSSRRSRKPSSGRGHRLGRWRGRLG